ncbi:MAG: hypothetical protein WC947_10060 [Elusimicrobiota bacterium]
MARKSRSIGDEISRFKVMLGGLKNNSADFSFLKDELKTTETNISKLETENSKQEKLKADLKSQTEAVNTLLNGLQKSYASYVRYVNGKYGPKAAKLREFIPQVEGEVKSTKPKG